nr:hypothetical protein [uncultured Undibacterium sp.]
MKKILQFISVLPLFAIINTVSAANKLSVDQYIANYSKSYIALGLGGEMDLSYQKQIGKILKAKNLTQQQAF